jgi:hypothetical protein
MNKILPPDYPRLVRRDHGDVEALLHDFFRSEVPVPWPAPPVVAQEPAQVIKPFRRPRFGRYARLAMAAAVATLLIGYLTLAAFFPRLTNSGAGLENQGTIGDNPLRVATPSGVDALLWEKKGPGDARWIHVREAETPPTKR